MRDFFDPREMDNALIAYALLTWLCPLGFAFLTLPVVAYAAGLGFGERFGLHRDFPQRAFLAQLALLAMAAAHISAMGTFAIPGVLIALTAWAYGESRGAMHVRATAEAARSQHLAEIKRAWRR